MHKTLTAYVAGLVTLMAGDILWLGFIMPEFYRAHLVHLMAETVVWPAALAFYLVYSAGVFWFVVRNNAQQPLRAIATQGALLGGLCYGVYDLTNNATLQGWPLVVTLVDMAWGTALTAAVSTAMAWALRKAKV